jgi:SAM-dependent methyltransferase
MTNPAFCSMLAIAIDAARQIFESAATTCPTCREGRVTHLDFTSDADALISGCRNCGLVFMNPMPTAEQVAARYAPGGNWSRKVDQRKVNAAERRALKDKLHEHDPLKPWMLPHANLLYQAGARHVLDIGCEQGKMLDRLQRRGWTTYGVDPNTHDSITRHQMLSELPKEPCFDLVIMQHVLEHLSDPLTVLRDVRKAIRDDGHLFVGTPSLDGLAAHGMKHYCINQSHVTGYTARSLRHLLYLAGFSLARKMPNRQHRMSFIYRPSRPSRGYLWPLRDAQLAFGQLAYSQQGWRGWIPLERRLNIALSWLPIRQRADRSAARPGLRDASERAAAQYAAKEAQRVAKEAQRDTKEAQREAQRVAKEAQRGAARAAEDARRTAEALRRAEKDQKRAAVAAKQAEKKARRAAAEAPVAAGRSSDERPAQWKRGRNP